LSMELAVAVIAEVAIAAAPRRVELENVVL
jgi:hypothetical protein